MHVHTWHLVEVHCALRSLWTCSFSFSERFTYKIWVCCVPPLWRGPASALFRDSPGALRTLGHSGSLLTSRIQGAHAGGKRLWIHTSCSWSMSPKHRTKSSQPEQTQVCYCRKSTLLSLCSSPTQNKCHLNVHQQALFSTCKTSHQNQDIKVPAPWKM